MVRVRANESVKLAVAKRIAMAPKQINTQNKGGETSNLPTQREIGGGETPNPPSAREIRGGETPNAPSQNAIVGRETSNPMSPRGSVSIAKGNTKRRKTQNEGGETSNTPPQREIVGGETLNSPSPREIGGGETLNQTQTEIGGRETSNSSPPREETGGGRETVPIDTELLDCSICTNPLCPPLYQCMNGHVACPSCWSKVQHKCHICNVPVVTRNIALEKVLESAYLPCTYANLGCRESVSYSQRQMHADTCEFGPSLCPIPGCAHKASSGEWRGHFLQDHRDRSMHYCYGHPRTIKLNEEDPYYSFIGPGKDVFLLVKEPIPNFGIVISLFYIDLPDRDNNCFSYELEEWPTGRCYKSPAVSIKEWKRGEVHVSSLLVPSQVLLLGYKVYVLINKKSYVSSSD